RRRRAFVRPGHSAYGGPGVPGPHDRAGGNPDPRGTIRPALRRHVEPCPTETDFRRAPPGPLPIGRRGDPVGRPAAPRRGPGDRGRISGNDDPDGAAAFRRTCRRRPDGCPAADAREAGRRESIISPRTLATAAAPVV